MIMSPVGLGTKISVLLRASSSLAVSRSAEEHELLVSNYVTNTLNIVLRADDQVS